MKKEFLYLASTALLIACGSAPEETANAVVEEEPAIAANSNWKTSHLIGKVKSIEESTYTADSLGVVSEIDSCCVELRNFNNEGYIETYVEKDNDGNVVFESQWERFEDGRWKSSTNKRNGRPAGGRLVTLNEDGTVLHAVDRDSTGNVTYYYDNIKSNEIGQPLEGTRYRGDSTFTGIWTREYTDGMRTGWGWSDSTGTMVSQYTAELNDQGWFAKRTEVRNAGTDSVKTMVTTFTYDELDEVGNWTKRTRFDEEGKIEKVWTRNYTYFE